MSCQSQSLADSRRRHPWAIKQALAPEEVLNKGLLKEAVSLKVTLCGAQDLALPPSDTLGHCGSDANSRPLPGVLCIGNSSGINKIKYQRKFSLNVLTVVKKSLGGKITGSFFSSFLLYNNLKTL